MNKTKKKYTSFLVLKTETFSLYIIFSHVFRTFQHQYMHSVRGIASGSEMKILCEILSSPTIVNRQNKYIRRSLALPWSNNCTIPLFYYLHFSVFTYFRVLWVCFVYNKYCAIYNSLQPSSSKNDLKRSKIGNETFRQFLFPPSLLLLLALTYFSRLTHFA